MVSLAAAVGIITAGKSTTQLDMVVGFKRSIVYYFKPSTRNAIKDAGSARVKPGLNVVCRCSQIAWGGRPGVWRPRPAGRSQYCRPRLGQVLRLLHGRQGRTF